MSLFILILWKVFSARYNHRELICVSLCVLSRLSLIEDDVSEGDPPEIEVYESDSDCESAYTLVKTNKNPGICFFRPFKDKLHTRYTLYNSFLSLQL